MALLVQMMDYKDLSTVLDWIGSLLMLGTLWGWIYAKLSPAIKRKSIRSVRRVDAMIRLFRQKYGEPGPDGSYVGGADQRVRRVRNYRAKLGIKPDWPPLVRLLVETANLVRIRTGYRNEKVSEEEFQELLQYGKASRGITGFLIRYLVATYSYSARLILLSVIDGITASMFSGRGGTILFVVGFVLWNLSKGIALFLP